MLDEHQIKEIFFTRRQRLFNIVLRHLNFEAARQTLPKSGADDGMLWNILPTPLLRSTLARWLQIRPDFSPFEKVRQKSIRPTMDLVSKLFQNLATDNRSKRTVSVSYRVLIDTESLIIVCSGRLKVRALETPVSCLLNSITYLCML